MYPLICVYSYFAYQTKKTGSGGNDVWLYHIVRYDLFQSPMEPLFDQISFIANIFWAFYCIFASLWIRNNELRRTYTLYTVSFSVQLNRINFFFTHHHHLPTVPVYAMHSTCTICNTFISVQTVIDIHSTYIWLRITPCFAHQCYVSALTYDHIIAGHCFNYDWRNCICL